MKIRTVKLDALCDRIDYGFTATADFSINEPRFLRITDIQNGSVKWNLVPGCRIDPAEEAEKRLSAGDIVFARTGATTGKCFLIEHAPRAVFASYLIRLRATADVLPTYLYAFFQSERYWHQIRHAVRGAAQGGVNATTLSLLKVPLPDLSEQQRIADQFRHAERLRRTSEFALELTDTLLPSAFHRLAGEGNPRSADWPIAELVELCASEEDIRCGPFGTQLNKREFKSAGVPLWGIKHVNSDFRIQTHEFLTETKAEMLEEYSLLPGDLVMTRKGTVGNCALYPAHFPPGVMHSDLLRIRLKAGACSPVFLAHQLHHSHSIARQIDIISGGAIMAGINVGLLKSIKVQLPPYHLQERFEAVVQRTERLRALQREALRQAEHLYASVLKRAFGR